MIAIDANLLLRRLLGDDPEQGVRAQHLFDSGESVLITDIVLIETVWILTGPRYGASGDEIAAMVMSLLEEPYIVFESKLAVWSALNDFMTAEDMAMKGGLKLVDFASALTINKAKHVASLRNEAYTFVV